VIYLLDTNVVLHLVNRTTGHEGIRDKLKNLTKIQIGLSSITATELWYKSQNKQVSKRALAETAAMLNACRILPFKGDAARTAGLMLAKRHADGTKVGNMDVMLAAHAVVLDATVVTDNTKDFIASGCKLANWRQVATVA
jgi:tRNA(fMet)-specific endonuclease VapC